MRARLTLLYALLFLAAGSSLLALTYGLLASRLPATGKAANNAALKDPSLGLLCKQPAQTIPASVIARCKQVFAAGASAGIQSQRDRALSSLLFVSLVGLGVVTVVSGALGWIVSGRVLRPIRTITETARRASELHLGQRLALTGPRDELKELADTFDQMLARLDAAFASQKRFVANAAHELRTPLTVIRTSIDVTLSKRSRTPEQLEAMAVKVRRSVLRAEATVEALLTLAWSEQAAAPRELVDLATATEDVLDAASASIAELRLTVESRLDAARTIGDSVLLERMIANLVDNAVRHNHRGGWIQVRTGERVDGSFFEIANTGPVVPEDAIPALIEPFGRARQRVNTSEGVGLGLSIANAVAIAHGARPVAMSRSAGGLDVSIVLPPAQEPTPVRPPSTSES